MGIITYTPWKSLSGAFVSKLIFLTTKASIKPPFLTRCATFLKLAEVNPLPEAIRILLPNG